MSRKKVEPETNKGPEGAAPATRRRISQADIPRHSLREALTIARAITDNFAGHATSPHQIAMALKISPTSAAWRTLTGAAAAYGFTTGAYGSNKIGLEDLGRRATAPREEGDDLRAMAEAALKPRVFAQFIEKYQRAKFPPDNIARNVLEQDFGVPRERADEVLTTLKDNGAFVGFIHRTKTGPFVATDSLTPSPVTLASTPEVGPEDHDTGRDSEEESARQTAPPPTQQAATRLGSFKVFISHGKDMGIVDQVKDVLDLSDIDYEVATEEETTAIPVPQKVLAAMRRCEAGVMIVSADDDNAAAASMINDNVLIEIGAAFVLYDQKVVLLWDKRLKVPSNLQGLYRCEFEGAQLTLAGGTKLAKAVKGFRK
jgi:predicted nucleotide-binding protein